MAKTSAIQKNLKRIKLVKKFANKRAALKKIKVELFQKKVLLISQMLKIQIRREKKKKQQVKNESKIKNII